MPFEIVRNNLVNMEVDAVVNTANPNPVIGSGVDSEVHAKAGAELIAAREKIGHIDVGAAAITSGYELAAKYVIHTVGPIWSGGSYDEEQILVSCYRSSLALAKNHQCESVAFPLIATGNYKFPKSLALQIAVREISSFLIENEMQIYLVVFDKDAFELSEKLFKSVSSYIDENYIRSTMLKEYDNDSLHDSSLKTRWDSDRTISDTLNEEDYKLLIEECFEPSICAAPTVESEELSEMLENLDAGFSETLLKLIDRTGRKDSEIYKKANIDRKLFSKIRNNLDYKPSKSTALAFAFALELDIEETQDFIGRAGFVLSPSSKFDVIVEFFLINGNYNIYELNEVLFAFDQPLIGA